MAHCKVESPSKLADARVVEIGRVVVVPGARGLGVGRALVAAAQEFARERGVTDLSARIFAGNDESFAFWRALGFESFVETLVRRGDA